MSGSKNRDLIIGVVFILFSVAAFVYTFTFVNRVPTDVGPAYFPRIVTSLLGLLGLFKIIAAFRTSDDGLERAPSSDEKGGSAQNNSRAGILTIILLALYVFLLRPVGFIPCTMVYLFMQSTIFNSEKETLPLRIGISVVLPFALYFLFVEGFSLMLPSGTIW